MEALTSILYFLIVLGFVVVFHEWGHFIVAKLCGAKVKTFAVGMGHKLFGYKWHDTDYIICALPIGGYVNIEGMSPEDETTGAPWEYLELAPWKRILIVVAGPVMNFVLAFLIYFFIFSIFGQTYTGTRTIGDVPVGSWGWEMGLHEGDEITAINDHEVESWDDVVAFQNDFQGGQLRLTVVRNGETLSKFKEVPAYIFDAISAETTEAIEPPSDYEGIFVSSVLPNSAAEKFGITPGTIIQSVDGQTFETRMEWSEYLAHQFEENEDGSYAPKDIQISMLLPDGSSESRPLTPDLVYPAEDAIPQHPISKIGLSYDGEIKPKEYFSQAYALNPLGISPKLAPVIGTVQDNSPADMAGVTSSSRIVEMNGEPVDNWVDVMGNVQDSVVLGEDGQYKAEPVKLTWLSPNNEMKSADITPSLIKSPIMTQKSLEQGKVYYIAQLGFNVQQDRIRYGVIGSIVEGYNATLLAMWRTYDVLSRLVTGGISYKVMGGPIAIFNFSAEHGRWGIEMFFTFIAFFSVNLGMINLVPIPPLDGGHIVVYTCEWISRRKITMHTMENFGKVGIVLIIPLMLLMVFNDLMRLDVFEWIGSFF